MDMPSAARPFDWSTRPLLGDRRAAPRKPHWRLSPDPGDKRFGFAIIHDANSGDGFVRALDGWLDPQTRRLRADIKDRLREVARRGPSAVPGADMLDAMGA